MSLLDALVFRPILLAIHAADIFTQSLSLATTAGLIPSGLCLSSAPSKHKIPKHVAFSLVTSDGWELGLLDRRIRRNGQQRRNLETPPYELKSRSSNKGKEKETCVQAETDEEAGSTMEKQILLSTIQEAVRWAAVRDIGEVSIWNEDGLLDEYLDSVISFLVERPPTPPASGTSSPPPYNRQRCTNLTKPDGSPTSFPTIAAQPSSSSDMQSSWIQMEPPHTQESHSSLHSHDAKEPLTDFSASRSFTVWPDIEDIVPEYHYFNTASSSSASTTPSETTGPLLRGTNARKPVTIHILSGEAGDPMIAHITKKLIAEGVPSERVSQQMMEELVQEQLHFQHDPCLLIIQPLAFELTSTRLSRQTMMRGCSQLPLTYRLLKQIIPSDPPQLHGYPFWPLRVTEIYQSPITSCGTRNLVQSPDHRIPWSGLRKRSDGAATEGSNWMVWASWDYGIQRWQGVEQRLGR